MSPSIPPFIPAHPTTVNFVSRLLAFPILALGMGAAAAGEVSNTELLAQIQSLREAYEGRIAALEAEVKTVKEVQAETRRVTTIQKSIDKTLGKSSAVGLITQRSYQPASSSAGNAVHSTSNMTLGGYSEFTYTDRGDRTACGT